MKPLIPVWLKWLPWYLFKSSQRKTGLLRSWITELRGGLALLFSRTIYNSKSFQHVSICTGIKNRTNNYLDYLLESVLKMDHLENIELSIFDCGSDDVQILEDNIRKKWKGKLIITSEPHPFERSYSFNKAIMQSSYELFFTADADMTLPKNLVAACNRYITKNSVWFPVCFDLDKGKLPVISPENGKWRYSGKGMFAATKNQFVSVGRYDEKYKVWGDEDQDLWLRFYKYGLLPVRNRCEGLFHHYHEPVPESRHQ